MTYATLDQLRTYAGERGLTIPVAEAECSVLLTIAHDWLECQRFKGVKADPVQLDSWPRRDVVVEGYELSSSTVPAAIINAECQLAIDSHTVDLMPTGEGREVLSEDIAGAIKYTYAETGKGAVIPEPTKAKAMIRHLTLPKSRYLRACRR